MCVGLCREQSTQTVKKTMQNYADHKQTITISWIGSTGFKETSLGYVDSLMFLFSMVLQ